MNLPRLAIKPIRPPVGLPQPVIRQPEPPTNIIGDKEAMQVREDLLYRFSVLLLLPHMQIDCKEEIDRM